MVSSVLREWQRLRTQVAELPWHLEQAQVDSVDDLMVWMLIDACEQPFRLETRNTLRPIAERLLFARWRLRQTYHERGGLL